MSRHTRVFQLRAPLQIKNFLAESSVKPKDVRKSNTDTRQSWREVSPTFVADRANRTGGATVLITGDPDDKSGKVEVQVAFCSRHDAFSRKRGRSQAALTEKYVVEVTDIPRELRDIEHQMLSQLSPYLARHHEVRNELTRPDWVFAMYFFIPKAPEAVNG